MHIPCVKFARSVTVCQNKLYKSVYDARKQEEKHFAQLCYQASKVYIHYLPVSLLLQMVCVEFSAFFTRTSCMS
jgi:hypothetical protein